MSSATPVRALRSTLRGARISGRTTVGLPRALHASSSTQTPREPQLSTQSKPSSSGQSGKTADHRYNYNTSLSFDAEPDPEHAKYRRVTAAELASRREPPTRVKMLVRDFVDDSLYNPHYGYFARNAVIFTPPDKGFDFSQFRDSAAFQEAVADRYVVEYANDPAEAGVTGGLGRQVWHTPTELFKPHYARSLANAILSIYKLNHFPYEDLILYEVGAGNGSFMVDTLTYLRDEHPEVYARTRYRIIEISGMLAKGQRERAERHGFGQKVEVVNENFFEWQGGGVENCFFVALEVFDNFAHDMVRYDLENLTPLQAVVTIDGSGDFSLIYEPVTDPLLRRYLAYRRLLSPTKSTLPPVHPLLLASSTLRKLFSSLPFAPNLSEPEFIPTKAMLFLERLRERLPLHRLMVADFSELPDAVKGRNGPVVQTRYGGSMVPCETFLVKQGFFDIFFPTDFGLVRDLYSLIMNSPPQKTTPVADKATRQSKPNTGFFSPKHDFSPTLEGNAGGVGVRGFKRRSVNIYDQAEFLELFGGEQEVGPTRTGDGASVMTSMYKNAKIMF